MLMLFLFLSRFPLLLTSQYASILLCVYCVCLCVCIHMCVCACLCVCCLGIHVCVVQRFCAVVFPYVHKKETEQVANKQYTFPYVCKLHLQNIFSHTREEPFVFAEVCRWECNDQLCHFPCLVLVCFMITACDSKITNEETHAKRLYMHIKDPVVHVIVRVRTHAKRQYMHIKDHVVQCQSSVD